MTEKANFVCRDCSFQTNFNDEAWTHHVNQQHRFFKDFAPKPPATIRLESDSIAVASLPTPVAPPMNTPIVTPQAASSLEAHPVQTQLILRQFATLETRISIALTESAKEFPPDGISDGVIITALLDMVKGFCEWHGKELLPFVTEHLRYYGGMPSMFYSILAQYKNPQGDKK